MDEQSVVLTDGSAQVAWGGTAGVRVARRSGGAGAWQPPVRVSDGPASDVTVATAADGFPPAVVWAGLALKRRDRVLKLTVTAGRDDRRARMLRVAGT